MIVVGAGCGTVGKRLPTRFFPDPPDPPKLQFLQRIQTSNDIRPHSKMEAFVTGGVKLRAFGKIYGVTVHDGKIYVCDVQGSDIVVIDPIRESWSFFDGEDEGDIKRPVNIAIDADGTRYITDYQRHQVLVFDANNRYVRAFGKTGETKPIGVAVYKDRLYLGDTLNHEVQVLDKRTGEHLATIGGPGQDPGEFYNPIAVTVGSDGKVYVTDMFNARFQIFDGEGTFLKTFGKRGDRAGAFARPKGIAVDPNGFIYVVDTAFENVQIFSPEGKVALVFGWFGGPKVPGALWLPAGICISDDAKLLAYYQRRAHPDFVLKYLVLVTSQYGPAYVNVYGFGDARPGTALAAGKGARGVYVTGKGTEKVGSDMPGATPEAAGERGAPATEGTPGAEEGGGGAAEGTTSSTPGGDAQGGGAP